MAIPEKTPEILVSLQNTIKVVLEEKQIPPDQAEEIAVIIYEKISSEWGGSMLYIPKSTNNLLCRRNEKILSEFDGANHAELARKYHVSVQWLYALLRKKNKGKKLNKSE